MVQAKIPLFRVNVPSWQAMVARFKPIFCGTYWAEGDEVAKFEDGLRRFFGTPNVFATNSCTSALGIALRLADVLITIPQGYQLFSPMMWNMPEFASTLPNRSNVLYADIQRTIVKEMERLRNEGKSCAFAWEPDGMDYEHQTITIRADGSID